MNKPTGPTQAEIDAAESTCDTIDRNRKKWEAWFPHPSSGVEVPRDELYALVSIARAYILDRELIKQQDADRLAYLRQKEEI